MGNQDDLCPLPLGVASGAGEGDDDGDDDDDGHDDGDDEGDDDGDDDDDDNDSGGLQWYLNEIGAPRGGNVRNVTIAVLDSGVAYENWTDDSGTYVQAPSLANSAIRS